MNTPCAWNTHWGESLNQGLQFCSLLLGSLEIGEVLLSGSISEWVVLELWLSLSTTSSLPNCLQFVSPVVLHPVEHLRLQSRLHASNSSEWKTMPLHCAFPSLYHPLDLQAHLKTTTSSENSSHWENRFLVCLWLEVWIQFSLSSEFASPHCFQSYTDGTDQNPKLHTQYESCPLLDGFPLDVKVSYKRWWIFHWFSCLSMLLFRSTWLTFPFSACNIFTSVNSVAYVHRSMTLLNVSTTLGIVNTRTGSTADASAACTWGAVALITKGGGVSNSVSAMYNTSVFNWKSRDCPSAPYSPTLEECSPTKLTVATP